MDVSAWCTYSKLLESDYEALKQSNYAAILGSSHLPSVGLHDNSLGDQLQALLVMHLMRAASSSKQDVHSAKRCAAEELVPATPSKRLTLLQIAPVLRLPDQAPQRPLANATPAAAALQARCSAVQPVACMQQGSNATSRPYRGGASGDDGVPKSSSELPMQPASAPLPMYCAPLRTWAPPGAASVAPTAGDCGGTSSGISGSSSGVIRGLASNGFTILVAPQRGPLPERGPPPPLAPPPSVHRPRAVLRVAVCAPPAGPDGPTAPACAGAAVPAVGSSVPGEEDSAMDVDSAPAAAPPAVLLLPEKAPEAARISRRNIVQRLAELSSLPQQQASSAPASKLREAAGPVADSSGADAASAQQQQPNQALAGSECVGYVRKIGRFLGYGDGSEEGICDRPASLMARAALNRYLKSQVGQAKQDVWSDLNGEVGGVLMKRLISRTTQLAASRRQQSGLAPQQAPASHVAFPVTDVPA